MVNRLRDCTIQATTTGVKPVLPIRGCRLAPATRAASGSMEHCTDVRLRNRQPYRGLSVNALLTAVERL
jgi:hypothetical protein